VGIAAETGEHLLRPTEGRLGIDHPVEAAQRIEPSGEGGRLRLPGEIAAEDQAAGIEGPVQLGEEQAIATTSASAVAAPP
jgi:hypothetical protein